MSDDGGWLLAGPTAPELVRPFYDEWVPTYDETLHAWGYQAPDHAAGLLLDALAGGATSILDAGCGTGLVGQALRDRGYLGHLTGIDLSPASLEAARNRGTYSDTHIVDMQQGLDFADDAFDALICVGVLTYVPDTDAIWREFARMVRPGGVVVCTQRQDMWDQRSCDVVATALEADGVWQVRQVSEPLPYMPGHADYTDQIGVRYLVANIK